MRQITFNNRFGGFAVILPDNHVEIFNNGGAAPYEQAPIYISTEDCAEANVMTSLAWEDKEKLNEPLPTSVLYFMEKATKYRKALLQAKEHPHSAYIEVSIEEYPDKKGFSKIHLAFINDDPDNPEEDGKVLSSWSTQHPISNDLITEDILDQFIAQLISPTLNEAAATDTTNHTETSKKEDGADTEEDDGENDYRVTDPDGPLQEGEGVTNSPAAAIQTLLPFPSPGDLSGSEGPPDDESLHERSGGGEKRQYNKRKHISRPIPKHLHRDIIVPTDEPKPKPQPQRYTGWLAPFKWVGPNKTIPLYEGLIPPDSIAHDIEYHSLLNHVQILERKGETLTHPQIGYVRRVRQLLNEYYEARLAQKARVVRMEGRVFTYQRVDPEEKKALMEKPISYYFLKKA